MSGITIEATVFDAILELLKSDEENMEKIIKIKIQIDDDNIARVLMAAALLPTAQYKFIERELTK